MPVILALLLQAFATPAQTTLDAGAAINGLWMTGDGTQIHAIESDAYTTFDYSGVACIESDSGDREGFLGTFSHVQEIGPERVVFWDEDLETPVTRLTELPAVCGGDKAAADPALLARVLATYFDRLYATFEARGVDREEFLTSLLTLGEGGFDDFWSGLRPLLRQLDDAHLFATNDGEGAARRSAVSAAPTGLREILLRRVGEGGFPAAYPVVEQALESLIRHDVLLGDWTETANGNLVWGWLRPDVAYVQIPSMSGWTDETFQTIAPFVPIVGGHMDAMAADVAGADAIVLDLRRNRGGSDVLTRLITSYFLREPVRLSVRTRAGDGWAPTQHIDVAPAENALAAPLYVLIDVNTVSGGEIMAMLLDQNPHVTLIGETTRGAFSGTRWLLLPGGGFVGMPYQQTLNGQGELFAGRGVEPDVRVETFPAGRLISGYLAGIEAALRMHDDAVAIRRR